MLHATRSRPRRRGTPGSPPTKQTPPARERPADGRDNSTDAHNGSADARNGSADGGERQAVAPDEARIRRVQRRAEQRRARVARRVRPRPGPGSRPRLAFRPEIEGLRAVAVVLVVIDHIAAQPRGGFIGVDVFFVISGYLITGLLTDEYAATRRISILGFYRRRARRILPAAVLVLVATWIAARLLFFASRAHQTAVDVYWAAVFGANIHFASIDTDYFQANRPQSPVQHFWSLAVEEQFYLVWPLALFALLWAGRRVLRRRRHVVPIAVAALALVVLFALAVWLTRRNSATAYFETPARAWELAAGALLALVLSTRAALPARLTEVVMALGLVTVLGSAFVVRADGHFPAPSAALPVAGALLVILAAGSGRTARSAVLLTNPVARYVGRLSYSLYLWHWPVIIFVQARLVGSRPYVDAVCLGLMIALTLLSYHFVEDPIRRHGLAALRPGRPRGPRRTRAAGLSERGYVALGATACLLLSFIVWQAQPYRAVRTFGGDVALADNLPPAAQRPPGEVVPPAALAVGITRALDATRFPTLHPALSDLPSATVPEWHACGNVGRAQLAGCTFPGAATGRKHRPVVVIGDSIGITWLPAVRGLQAQGYTVYGLTYGQCPAADVDVKPSVGNAQDFSAQCNAHRNWAIREVHKLHAGIVVLANSAETIGRLADGTTGAAAFAQWRSGTARTARRVQAAGARRVVLLSPPPPAPDLQTCAASTSSTPGDCVSQLSQRWRGLVHAEAAAARQTGIVYVDVRLLFCSESGYCPSFVGSTPVRVDGLHLTTGYSTRLAGILDPIIAGSAR